jgi:antitoxin (DNA-binding transcriptional repressor) of toxin-antitoxin stability system
MKMGIKEFKERISEITASGEPVVITNHGKPVASYMPFKRKDPKKVKDATAAIRKWQKDLRAKGIEPEDLLAKLGLDPWGTPINERADC